MRPPAKLDADFVLRPLMSAGKTIYLDANATSRPRPCLVRVLSELVADEGLRNASSVHALGRKARARLNQARRAVLAVLNGGEIPRDQRLFFTSGGTEGCNTLVFGFLGPMTALAAAPAHVISTAIEHPAVLESLTVLARSGWSITRIAPAKSGAFAVEAVVEAVRPETALVTLMAANNETGAIQPVVECARALRASGYRGVITSDATQLVGKSTLTARELFAAGVNAIAVSGHKVGAPSGIGAVVLATGDTECCYSFEPLLHGGPQESYDRPGTENLFGALAFGEVCRELAPTLAESLHERRVLRERLWRSVRQIPDVFRLTPEDESGVERALANTLLLRCVGCRGDDLVVALDLAGVAASTGSACASGKQGVSHVLTAMGYDSTAAREVVRLSLDWDTTSEQVDRAAEVLGAVVTRMRTVQGGEHLARNSALEGAR